MLQKLLRPKLCYHAKLQDASFTFGKLRSLSQSGQPPSSSLARSSCKLGKKLVLSRISFLVADTDAAVLCSLEGAAQQMKNISKLFRSRSKCRCTEILFWNYFRYGFGQRVHAGHKSWGINFLRKCMRGLYSHSCEYRKSVLRDHLPHISQNLERIHFGANTCRACIRTRANT